MSVCRKTEWREKRDWAHFHLDLREATGGENECETAREAERSLSELKAEQTLLTGSSTRRWARLQQKQSLQTRATRTHTAKPMETSSFTRYHTHCTDCMFTNTFWQTGNVFLFKREGKRNYSPTAVKEKDIFIDFHKIMKFLWENLTYCQAWLKSAVSCIFCTDIDGKLERINVKCYTLLHGTHNKISQNI